MVIAYLSRGFHVWSAIIVLSVLLVGVFTSFIVSTSMASRIVEETGVTLPSFIQPLNYYGMTLCMSIIILVYGYLVLVLLMIILPYPGLDRNYTTDDFVEKSRKASVALAYMAILPLLFFLVILLYVAYGSILTWSFSILLFSVILYKIVESLYDLFREDIGIILKWSSSLGSMVGGNRI